MAWTRADDDFVEQALAAARELNTQVNEARAEELLVACHVALELCISDGKAFPARYHDRLCLSASSIGLYLRAQSPVLVSLSARCLERLGPHAASTTPRLVALAQHDGFARLAVIRALAVVDPQNRAAAQALLEAADDPKPEIRSAAIRGLGRQGRDCSDTAYASIWIGLVDSLADVRESAAWALGQLGSRARDAIPKLQEMLTDRSKHVRSAVSEAIVAIHRSRGKRIPRRAALDQQIAICVGMLRSPKASLRQSACEQLGEMGTAAVAALPALETSLTDGEPKERATALRALGQIVHGHTYGLRRSKDIRHDRGYVSVVRAILRMVDDPVDEVRAACVQALSPALHKEARQSPYYVDARLAMIDALIDPSPIVRLPAAEALLSDLEWEEDAWRTVEGCLEDPEIGSKAQEIWDLNCRD